MRECDPRGEERLNLFPLSVAAWIIGSITVWPADCLEDRPASHWLNTDHLMIC